MKQRKNKSLKPISKCLEVKIINRMINGETIKSIPFRYAYVETYVFHAWELNLFPPELLRYIFKFLLINIPLLGLATVYISHVGLSFIFVLDE